MSAWVFISIAAAAFQTLRFMLQKHLSTGELSTGGATFARFAYSAPFITLLTAAYWQVTPDTPGALSGVFWAYALVGGLAQILATWCVVAIFASRNFAVGITFKKTEVVLTALVGFVVLGDSISLSGLIAILIGLIGVLILSEMPGGAGGWARRLINRAAGLGLLSGVFFAVSAVAYRGATLEISSTDPLMRASLSLMAVTLSQAIGMALWLGWREKGELSRVWAARRTAVWTGITGLAGSLCWFTAFTLQNAAYVFAVGQVEVIFSIAASVLFFREKITGREVTGIALLSLSIVALVLLH
ncbi:DMT family transporter [Shimia biformata]|uniref:DMT family transporter n=1 Tax=Shimia biformata TaxID=1294299 RepID=UPI001951ECE8|nr:DMT family transporter [Shimia biformata]